MRREGESVAGISRAIGVSEPTVRKYLKPRGLSPKIPAKAKGPSAMDAYAAKVDSRLEADRGVWHKQRHTAQRVWERLVEEEHATMSYSTVRRYAREWKDAHRSEGDGFLDQVGIPADMQVDFGQTDFHAVGVRTRLHHLVCNFPFSNMGLAQVFPGENAECVFEGPMEAFSYIGGVPRRIVFDNATGVGRKICGVIRTSKLFAAFAAHFGFDYVFCNADAGREKGGVENKVGALRRRLFVPLPHLDNIRSYNARLLDRCTELSGKEHYVKGEPESQLFMEDRFALLPLPEAPFKAVTWQRRRPTSTATWCWTGATATPARPSSGDASSSSASAPSTSRCTTRPARTSPPIRGPTATGRLSRSSRRASCRCCAASRTGGRTAG